VEAPGKCRGPCHDLVRLARPSRQLVVLAVSALGLFGGTSPAVAEEVDAVAAIPCATFSATLSGPGVCICHEVPTDECLVACEWRHIKQRDGEEAGAIRSQMRPAPQPSRNPSQASSTPQRRRRAALVTRWLLTLLPVRFGRGRLDSLGNKGLAAYLIAGELGFGA
jgi:hypothetical protein